MPDLCIILSAEVTEYNYIMPYSCDFFH